MNEDGIHQAHRRALVRYRQRCERGVMRPDIRDAVRVKLARWMISWENALEQQRDALLSQCRAATADRIRRRKRDRGKNQPRKR